MRFVRGLLPAQRVLFSNRRVLEAARCQRPDGVQESGFLEMPALAAPAAMAIKPVSVRPERWPER